MSSGMLNSLKDVLVNAVMPLIPEFVTVIGVVVIIKVAAFSLCRAIPFMAGIGFVQTASRISAGIFLKRYLNAYVHEDIAGDERGTELWRGRGIETRIFGRLTDQHQQSFVAAVRFSDMFGRSSISAGVSRDDAVFWSGCVFWALQ